MGIAIMNGVLTEKDKDNDSKLLPNNLTIYSSSSNSEELLINYINDLITSNPDKKKVDIVGDVVNYLEGCKKPLLEIKTIIENKNEDKAAILFFTYRFKLIYLNLYKKIHSLNPKSISFYLNDLQQKGLLLDVDKPDEYPKQRRLIEHAIKKTSRAGDYQINRINYKALTGIGEYLTRLFKDELGNIISEELKEKIIDIRTLLYHSHKQLEYVEQQRARRDAKRREIEEQEKAKAEKFEAILSDYGAEILSLRAGDFTPKVSEKVKELVKKIYQQRDYRITLSDFEDIWRESKKRTLNGGLPSVKKKETSGDIAQNE